MEGAKERSEGKEGETGKEGRNSNVRDLCFYQGEFEVPEEPQSCHAVLVNPDAFVAGGSGSQSCLVGAAGHTGGSPSSRATLRVVLTNVYTCKKVCI